VGERAEGFPYFIVDVHCAGTCIHIPTRPVTVPVQSHLLDDVDARLALYSHTVCATGKTAALPLELSTAGNPLQERQHQHRMIAAR
jgi:hypothetical protein